MSDPKKERGVSLRERARRNEPGAKFLHAIEELKKKEEELMEFKKDLRRNLRHHKQDLLDMIREAGLKIKEEDLVCRFHYERGFEVFIFNCGVGIDSLLRNPEREVKDVLIESLYGRWYITRGPEGKKFLVLTKSGFSLSSLGLTKEDVLESLSRSAGSRFKEEDLEFALQELNRFLSSESLNEVPSK